MYARGSLSRLLFDAKADLPLRALLLAPVEDELLGSQFHQQLADDFLHVELLLIGALRRTVRDEWGLNRGVARRGVGRIIQKWQQTKKKDTTTKAG